MTSSFRPGAAQMATARPMQTVQYQPSRATHVPSSSTMSPRGGGGGSPQFNTGSATFSTIQSWADNQAFMDIYMVNAFYLGTGQKSEYFMSFWKTATCFGLQFVGILLLMEDQWAAYNESSNGQCTGPNGNVAWIAFLFATYITMFCTEQIRTLNRYGMYGWGENQPAFVNSFWVGVGLW
eukprot:CAMPEP_0201594244 /NCGR_PEP_ID=MMETSP0190_2-20130828/191616_1 /ASSEMBLY_ACC=CAM_ASM_000263 /TAXON_ID=37353 /ORGANISM="Rosalina sp." /LENGTH=179 /DNA_ID=CAMNT_0048053775 /DNA_START=22 /DNA_END=558 /DNA_ORIENTATION=+